MLVRMARTIARRDPDDSGNWFDAKARIGLAHRRLSIVELSLMGHEPMPSADGRYVVSYNGEIDNRADTRAELDAGGGLTPKRGWRGHSDTESF